MWEGEGQKEGYGGLVLRSCNVQNYEVVGMEVDCIYWRILDF